MLGGISGTIECPGIAISGAWSSFGFWLVTRDDDTHSARVETLAIGATSAVLKTPADVSRFSVLQWVAVGGQDLFGYESSPPDPRIFEYRQITSIVGSTIFWATPLTNLYKSTWPLYHDGDAFHPDLGGPATLFVMEVEWDLDLTVNAAGSTFTRASGAVDQQMWAKCRRAIINGALGNECEFLAAGFIPTVVDYHELNYVINNTEETEFDKLYNRFVSTGTHWRRIKIQSCVGDLELNNDVVDLSISLPRVLTLNNVTVDQALKNGPEAFGYCESLTLLNGTTTPAITDIGFLTDDISGWEWMGGGVYRTNTPVLGGTGLKRLTTIGAWFRHVSSRSLGNPFQVTDAWQDGGYTYVQTTLSVEPTYDMGSSGYAEPDKWQMYGCLRVYSEGSGGALAYLDDAPQGRPAFWEYAPFSFSGVQSGSDYQSRAQDGEIVRIVVTVTQLCVGGPATVRLKLSQFGVDVMNDVGGVSTVTREANGWYIDLKAGSPRVVEITPDGVTGTHVSDSVAALSGWVLSGFSPGIDTDGGGSTSGASQQAIVTMQVYTNTGVVSSVSSYDLTVVRNHHLRSA
jgi:hypothetical protein